MIGISRIKEMLFLTKDIHSYTHPTSQVRILKCDGYITRQNQNSYLDTALALT